MQDKINTIRIDLLTKGYLVSGAASPNTLGPMNLFSAACKTPSEVLETVGELVGLTPDENVRADVPNPVPMGEAPIAQPAAVEPAEVSTVISTPVTNANREAVIKFLESAGLEIIKGIRNTTLTKMLDDHIKGITPPEAAQDSSPKADAPAPTPVPAPSASVCKLCFGTGKMIGDIDCPHCAKGGDLTMEIVRAAVNTILNKNMDKRPAITKAAQTGVGKLGFTRFPEIKDFNAAWPVIRKEIEAVLCPKAEGEDEWVM